MKIARCFSNVDNVYISKLPASTITLYTMTRLKREVLEAKLQSGEFNTRTTCEQVRALLPSPRPKKQSSPVNQLRRFYKGKHREAMMEELVNNPVLCETVPEEIEELMKEVRERRRQGNGQDDSATQPQQQPTTPSRWS